MKSSVSSSWWNVDEFKNWLASGKSGRAYARLHNVTEGAVRHRWNKYKDDRPVDRSKEAINKKEKQEKQVDIRRIIYGKIEPTMYSRSIDTLDDLVAWIQEFTPYMSLDWDNSNTRENAKVLFFDVFRDGKSRMIGKPRGSGKSKVSVAVYACILANYYYPQAIIVNGPRAKKRIFYGIWRVMKDAHFREIYGDIIESKNKVEGYFELHSDLLDRLYTEFNYVSDDPSISISVYSGIIGAHPYIVFLEDILQSEFKNEESNEYMLYEVFDGIISKLSDRIGGTLTRKGQFDLYSQLPSRNVQLIVKSAIVKLKGDWPALDDLVFDEAGDAIDIIIHDAEFEIIERPGWTIKSLLIMRTLSLRDRRSYELFEREMQNNAIASSGLYFDYSMYVETSIDLKELGARNAYVMTDPAFGKSKGASEAVVQVWAIYHYQFILLDMIVGRFGTNVYADNIISLADQYQARETHLENNFKQMTTKFDDESVLMNLSGLSLFEQDTNKIDRIMSLSGPFGRHKIVVHKNCRYKERFVEQMMNFDPAKAGSYDILDCTATAIERLAMKMRRSHIKNKIDIKPVARYV